MFIPAFFVPLFLTAICIGMMLRPYHPENLYDFSVVFRLFWLIPVGFIWAVYFAIGWWMA